MKDAGRPYKQSALDESWDAIVIGSGMGGLTAASLLARHAGKRVLVLERHYTAGGFTHTFRRPDYEWDVGVHYVGELSEANSPVRAAFDHLTEGRLQWNPMPDIYDRIVIGGRAYDFPAGVDRFRDRMKAYFPAGQMLSTRTSRRLRPPRMRADSSSPRRPFRGLYRGSPARFFGGGSCATRAGPPLRCWVL